MWKYVSRRAKETLERRCNVLDIRKSSWIPGFWQAPNTVACHSHQPEPGYPGENDFVCVVVSNRDEGDAPYIHCEKWSKSRAKDRKTRHDRNHCPIGGLLSAVTWSGAIVFGWYASQLLCLHRRRTGWEPKGNKSRYLAALNLPARAVHGSLLSRLVLTSPTYPSLISEQALLDNFASSRNVTACNDKNQQSAIFEVSNDQVDGHINIEEPKKQDNIDNSVADLVTFLGDTEYKMGVKSIAAGQYRTAVAHLKLAVSHNHPGATFNLGLCYEKRLGVPKNLKRAMECYQIASSMGHPKAMYNLGVFYAQGIGGLEKDHETAEKCFTTAANLGQPEAIKVLGLHRHRPKQDDVDLDVPPSMTQLIFDKNKTELYAATVKFL